MELHSPAVAPPWLPGARRVIGIVLMAACALVVAAPAQAASDQNEQEWSFSQIPVTASGQLSWDGM